MGKEGGGNGEGGESGAAAMRGREEVGGRATRRLRKSEKMVKNCPEGRGEMQEEAQRLHRLQALRSSHAMPCLKMGISVYGLRKWHSAGMFDMSSKTGGPFGTMRLKAEQGHTASNGIEIAVRVLEPIKSNSPCFLMLTSISWLVLLLEDLKFHFTLEGSGAVCMAFRFMLNGNSMENDLDDKDEPLPKVACLMLPRVSLSILSIQANRILLYSLVATLWFVLAITLWFPRRHFEDMITFIYQQLNKYSLSYWEDDTRSVQDMRDHGQNSYFTELLGGDKEGLMKLPSDKALLSDPVFRPLIEKYAVDEDAFFADYAVSHMQLSELA
ncbi:UNVERIFIED_CONTAM: L-ascorbate peroxidase 1, cytosolic [Sesamum calycinum]|uniref:L-ascorbate peroxidase 1, cytosolic n=1 Tax=Sesamum calycinum TaxID=2727403 RepID=A0AAW2SC79_9LAMI